jgi:hypothetical protein
LRDFREFLLKHKQINKHARTCWRWVQS